jgi:hypothetical protein
MAFKMNRIFMFLGTLTSLMSCENFSCETWVKNIRDNESFNLKLTSVSTNGRAVTLVGVDINSHLKIFYFDASGWLTDNVKQFNIGDTLIKKKHRYNIIVKRTGSFFELPLKCDKVYSDLNSK